MMLKALDEWIDIAFIKELCRHTVSIVAVAIYYSLIVLMLHFLIHDESILKNIEYIEEFFLYLIMIFLAYQFLYFIWLKRVKKNNDNTFGFLVA